MKKLYRIICSKYKKFEKPKIYLLSVTKNVLNYFFILFSLGAKMKKKII